MLRASRLRQVDLKAEHFERQVQRLEQERDQWEKKYEVRSCRDCVCHFTDFCLRLQEAVEKYRASKLELDELVSSMEGM